MAKTVSKTTPATPAAKPAAQPAKPVEQLPFQQINYILLAAGALVLFLGFFLMSLDASFVDATQFSIALHVAPWVIMLGFAEIIFAIMYRPKAQA